jgi:asparagine synthase (glutamine-hydrolysing)
MTMCWFGGYTGHPGERGWPRPPGARMLWTGLFPVWCAGSWPDSEVRVIRGRQQVAVIGPCAAADLTFAIQDVQGLAAARAGSYTIIQATPEELRVFTDLGFAWPVYLAWYAGGIVWGSSARPLAGLTGARPDPAWLSAALIDPAAPAHGARSPFEGITVAPPGSRVCLRPGRPPVITPAAPLTRRPRSEAVTGLRRALDEGIAARVRAASHPSSDLSGLDSGSVCMLAVRHVRPPGRVAAVTVHPVGCDEGGDLDCARRAIGPDVPVDHWLLPLGSGHLPGTALDQVPATDEPAPSAVTWARLAAEFTLLARLGSDCHLTGDGGDTLFHPGPGYLAGLADGHLTALGLVDPQQVRTAVLHAAPGLPTAFGLLEPVLAAEAWLRALAAAPSATWTADTTRTPAQQERS